MRSETAYRIQRLLVTEIETNSYLLSQTNGDAVIIDPGGNAEEILRLLGDSQLKLQMILNTHGHIDHVGANAALRQATGARIAIAPEDAPMLGSSTLSGAIFFGWDYDEHEPDLLLHDGDQVGHGAMMFEVMATPGHTPGSCVLYDRANAILFSGDLIFQGAVGRWDLPGGSCERLMRSLREKIVPLPDHTVIYPGHGPETTVGAEKRTNAYLADLLG